VGKEATRNIAATLAKLLSRQINKDVCSKTKLKNNAEEKTAFDVQNNWKTDKKCHLISKKRPK
jgi:hypothetical protein